MGAAPVVEVAVEAAGWEAWPEAESAVRRVIDAAFAGCGVPLRDQAEVSVLLSDDGTLRALNNSWRRQDKPTNVLSFPAASAKALATAPMLGDIAIAYETAAREAAEEAKTLADHVAHLCVHGFLHLVGFDHETEADAEAMEARERAILAGVGVADPYAQPP